MEKEDIIEILKKIIDDIASDKLQVTDIDYTKHRKVVPVYIGFKPIGFDTTEPTRISLHLEGLENRITQEEK